MTTTRSRHVYTISFATRQNRKSLQQSDPKAQTPSSKRKRMSSDTESMRCNLAVVSDQTRSSLNVREAELQSTTPLTPESICESIPSLPSPPSTPLSAPIPDSSNVDEEAISELPPSSTDLDQVHDSRLLKNNDVSGNSSSLLPRMNLDWSSSAIMNTFLPIFGVKASTDQTAVNTVGRNVLHTGNRSGRAIDTVDDGCDMKAVTGHLSPHNTRPSASSISRTAPVPIAATDGRRATSANDAGAADESARTVECNSTEHHSNSRRSASKHAIILRLSRVPTVYEEYSNNSVDWCRYCGATQSSQAAAFRPGIWGTKSLCNKHGCDVKAYGRLNKEPRLSLADFAHEKRSDRIRPILQEFCHVCFGDGSKKIVVMCDGCWQAFHPGCFGGAIPQEVIDETCDTWFCDPMCQFTRTTGRIDALLPKISLPYMRNEPTALSSTVPSKSAASSKPKAKPSNLKQVKSAKAASHSPVKRRTLPSPSEAYRRTRQSEQLLHREVLQQDIMVPNWSVQSLISSRSQISSSVPASKSTKRSKAKGKRRRVPSAAVDLQPAEVSQQDELLESLQESGDVEDLSDVVFMRRHAKYEDIERKSRIGTILS
ncbi:hypothetical protein SeMB42_g00101 [Synchytrium endobioticum]|nr:hypothetical protein SeMB42_g00101 [Synchytrium endobioticum]